MARARSPARPRAPLLLAAALLVGLGPWGALACTAPCSMPRPNSSPSTTYCLVDFAQTCAYDSGSAKNDGCEPCTLWNEATKACAAPTDPLDVKTCKGSNGYVLRKDSKCTATDIKWKVYPAKKPYIGVETIQADSSGSKFNFLFKGLWSSALTGQNPCAVTMSWTSSPPIAMMENSVQYRTKHLMHAHIGHAMDEFTACVARHLAASTTKKAAWTDRIACDFTNRGLKSTAETWVYLTGPVKTTASPNNVGTLVNRAFRRSNGPLKAFDATKNQWSGFGVTTATFQGKNYFAVMVYNYHDSAVASGYKFQVGEYELIRGA